MTHFAGVVCLIAFAALLVAVPLIAAVTDAQGVALFDSFYRSGALVFGAGHVVLPLLQAEVVVPGWTNDQIAWWRCSHRGFSSW